MAFTNPPLSIVTAFENAPPIYNGGSFVDQWLELVDCWARLYSMDEETQARKMLGLLEGEAFEVYLHLPRERRTLQGLTDALKKAFKPSKDGERAALLSVTATRVETATSASEETAAPQEKTDTTTQEAVVEAASAELTLRVHAVQQEASKAAKNIAEARQVAAATIRRRRQRRSRRQRRAATAAIERQGPRAPVVTAGALSASISELARMPELRRPTSSVAAAVTADAPSLAAPTSTADAASLATPTSTADNFASCSDE